MKRFAATDILATRRRFLQSGGIGLGAAALATLFDFARARADAASATNPRELFGSDAASVAPHFPPRAKSVIYLFMHGGPSQIDLFDHKPRLKEWHGQELPPSVRGTQRLTGMTSNQASLPLVAPPFCFAQHGQSGVWLSELLPHLATVADELCVLRAMHTEAINHDPAVTFLQTGHQQPGRPSMGAWLTYGLGSENHNLPAFVVLLSRGSAVQRGRPIRCTPDFGAPSSCRRSIRARSFVPTASRSSFYRTRRGWRPRRAGACSTASRPSIKSDTT